MRRCQAANPVTDELLSVQPSGHPWSISPKRGFKIRTGIEQAAPRLEIERSRREIRYDHRTAAIAKGCWFTRKPFCR